MSPEVGLIYVNEKQFFFGVGVILPGKYNINFSLYQTFSVLLTFALHDGIDAFAQLKSETRMSNARSTLYSLIESSSLPSFKRNVANVASTRIPECF